MRVVNAFTDASTATVQTSATVAARSSIAQFRAIDACYCSQESLSVEDPIDAYSVKEKVDAIKGVRLLAASIMAVLGIIYLAFAAFFGSLLETMEIAPALMAAVGMVYVVVAFGLFLGKRLFDYLGVIVPLVWASMGIFHYTVKPDPIEFPFITAEIIVILCCCYLIIHERTT